MSKKVHFYVNYKNMVVLEHYMNIIKGALNRNGFVCDDVISLDGLDKKDLFFFPMGIDAFKFYFKGYRNFILWQQGATADESYLRNHSRLRYRILNFMDCFSMKKAKMICFCSQYMQTHYEKLSHTSFAPKSYLMPCYNESLAPEFIVKKDYSKKNFAYVGSLDLWQCFEQTAALYVQIEQAFPDAFFKVLTFSVEKAENILKSLGAKNYEVKCVAKEQVQDELKDVVYGFLLREDTIVNRVATPTKLSSYMSVGIIPIFSDVLDDFYRASKNMKYVVPVSSMESSDRICEAISNKVDKTALQEEYEYFFGSYYGTATHMEKMSLLMKGVLK